VAEVVEADALEPGALAGSVEPPAQRRAVHEVAHLVAEHEVAVTHVSPATGERVEHREDLVDHRHGANATRLR
jgi:hypothetical protein